MTDGVVSYDSLNNPEIQITVDADLIPDIEKENNIKWYVSANNIRRKAEIKEVQYNEQGACNLVLQPEDNDIYKMEPVKKVDVIIMYGRKYVF